MNEYWHIQSFQFAIFQVYNLPEQFTSLISIVIVSYQPMIPETNHFHDSF